jgi:tetratricopeptide (TPR) repeat protein
MVFVVLSGWVVWKDGQQPADFPSENIQTPLGVEEEGQLEIVNLQQRAEQILQRPVIFKSEPPTVIKADIEKQIRENIESLREGYDNLISWISLGQLRKVIGDYEGARDAWEFASLIRPENSLSFHNLGDLYGSYLKDMPKAELNYLVSLKNDPANVNAYLNLADLYWYEGEKEKIPNLLSRGIRDNAKTEDKLPLLARLAKYYAESGDKENAIKYYQEIITLDPENAAVIQKEIDQLQK